MAASQLRQCTVPGCRQSALLLMQEEMFCVDHFLDHAFAQTAMAAELFQQRRPLTDKFLGELICQAQAAAMLLLNERDDRQIDQRERILEFLLCVANVYEQAGLPASQGSVLIH